MAHSELVSITPADGATLDAAPAQIILTFSANVIGDFTQVEVRDGSGPIAVVPAVSEDNAVTQQLPSGLANGTYTVIFKIVSADSHPISGQSTFTVNAPVQATSSATASITSTTIAPSVPESDDPDPSVTALTTGSTDWATPSGSGSPWRWIALFAIAGLAISALLVRRSRSSRGPAQH